MSNPDIRTIITPADFTAEPSVNESEANARATIDGPMLVPPTRHDFFRALDLAATEPNGFAREDIHLVEALWGTVDADLLAYGFVLSLSNGRRMYLQYIRDDLEDETKEELQILPMLQSERYPQLSGGGINWSDQVEDLNNHLTC